MRTVKVINLFTLLCVLSLATIAIAGEQSELLQRSQWYEQNLTTPPGFSIQQRALLAVSLAASETGNNNPAELSDALHKLPVLTTYVMSDTTFDWISDAWVGTDRTTYTYGSGNHRTNDMTDTSSDGVAWAHYYQTIFTYDGSGRTSTSTYQSRESSSWVNQLLYTYTYDGSGNLTQILHQDWSGGAWVNNSRSTITYSSGRIATVTTEEWQYGSSTWVNSSKDTYTYDGSGNQTVWLMQTWVGSSWTNLYLYTGTYNASGDELQALTEMWNAAWVNVSKTDYTYDGSHRDTLAIGSTWLLDAWYVTTEDTSKYTGNLLTEEVSVHILSVTTYRTQYTYDADNNQTLVLEQRWNLAYEVWDNDAKTVYVYQALAVEVDNGRIPSVFELSQNYPNPFNPITTIRYSLHRPSQVSITVFNLLGQEVRTLENGMQSAGMYETTWDGTNQTGGQVASGIYFYRIKAGENVETRKMLLLK